MISRVVIKCLTIGSPPLSRTKETEKLSSFYDIDFLLEVELIRCLFWLGYSIVVVDFEEECTPVSLMFHFILEFQIHIPESRLFADLNASPRSWKETYVCGRTKFVLTIYTGVFLP